MTSDENKLEVKIAIVETKIDTVLEKIDKLENNFANRIELLAATKLAASDFITHKQEQVKIDEDFETRIRFLERYAWAAIGIIAIVEIILNMWK